MSKIDKVCFFRGFVFYLVGGESKEGGRRGVKKIGREG